jgi:glycosyltransferase involved in cell wall biosynthesis
MASNLRVAFVHDWLVDKGGAENVLAALLELWPQAPVYTLVHDPKGPTHSFLEGHPIITSFLQKLPRATRSYRSYLPLLPLAIEQFDFSGFDLVISCSHSYAKGIITGPDQLHISYVFSPVRYAWDLQPQYLRESGLEHGLKSAVVRGLLHYIRIWDSRTANTVDEFMADSDFIARRIWKVYRRKATVIYPSVALESFQLYEKKEDFYLIASRMVPYKRIDLVVDAFAEMPDKKLVVIGDGPDFQKIRMKAKSNVQLLGYQPFDVLQDYMRRAKAFVFAAEEDFGIVLLEAQACGTPVIAYGKGGALETVIDGRTGLFFYEQNTESVQDAVRLFENDAYRFDPKQIRNNAERFSKERFHREFLDFVEHAWASFQSRRERIEYPLSD